MTSQILFVALKISLVRPLRLASDTNSTMYMSNVLPSAVDWIVIDHVGIGTRRGQVRQVLIQVDEMATHFVAPGRHFDAISIIG